MKLKDGVMPWGKQGCGSPEEHRGDLKLPDIALLCNITGQQLTGSGHWPDKKERADSWCKSGDHICKDPLLLSTICSLVIFLRQWTWFCACKRKIMQQSLHTVRWRAVYYSRGHKSQWGPCNGSKGQNNHFKVATASQAIKDLCSKLLCSTLTPVH